MSFSTQEIAETLLLYWRKDLEASEDFHKRWRVGQPTDNELELWHKGYFFVWGIPKDNPKIMRKLVPGE